MNQHNEFGPEHSAPTRAYDASEWERGDAWQNSPSAAGNAGEATQRFDWNDAGQTQAMPTTAQTHQAHSGQDYSSYASANQSTDDLEEVRQARARNDAPTMVMPAHHAPAPAPTPQEPTAQVRTSAPQFESRPLSHELPGHPTAQDAANRLRDLLPGPSAGARIGSLFVALAFTAVMVFMIWDSLRAADSVVMTPLIKSMGLSDPKIAMLVMAGLLTVPAIGLALSVMLSGLGIGLVGVAAAVCGTVMNFLDAGLFSYWAVLIPLGILFALIGAAAHVARVGGYRRARRIVQDM